MKCITDIQNKVEVPQYHRVKAGKASGEFTYTFCCTDNTMSSLMRHFQSEDILMHPPRPAFLLPGNRDTLSLSSVMSGKAGLITSCFM